MGLLNQAAAVLILTLFDIYNYFSMSGFVHVEIDKGVLRGSNSTALDGVNYSSFKGIPYAKPPVGEFRFKGPREEAAWVGVRDAVHHREVCPQIDMAFQVFRGKEDCLFLNVYTPSLGDERMPVLFWIHGGMYLFGSGNHELWGPEYFMKHGVVLVTINYRLGALGFLTTEDDEAPGNAGLKDQVAALKWVRRNIAKFGGDPDNVTIFGGSTGAACVHFHILSPLSSGLFKGAIAQSGTALQSWSLSENGPLITIRLAEALGAEDVAENKTKALQFLMTAMPEDMVNAQQHLMTSEEQRTLTLFLFRPSVEKNVRSEEVFLPDTPLNILKSGNFNKVPYVVGYNNGEGYFFMNEIKDPEIMRASVEDTDRYVPAGIKNKELRKKLAESIRQFYFDDRPVGAENISNLANLYSDVVFLSGIKRATKLHLEFADIPTYFYVFSYDGKINLVKYFFDIDCPGAVHGDELAYLFHQQFLFWRNPLIDSVDERVANTMIRLWINFAKYGNPTPPDDPVIWKAATLEEFNYLNISGLGAELEVDPNPDRHKFWENIYAINKVMDN